MVKFSKQLELQLVPEWKHAFCDYRKLKKDLKFIRNQLHINIHDSNFNNELDDQSKQHHNHLVANSRESATTSAFVSTYFTHLTRRKSPPQHPSHQDVIKVHHKGCSSRSQLEIYETEVLDPMSRNPSEVAFFKSVDEELNKVNAFYASKEDEYTHQMEVMKRQLGNLAEMRKLVDEQEQSSLSTSLAPNSIQLCFMTQYKTSPSTSTKPLLRVEDHELNKINIKSQQEKNSYESIHHVSSMTSNDFLDEDGELDSQHLNVVSTTNHALNFGENKIHSVKVNRQQKPNSLSTISSMGTFLRDNVTSCNIHAARKCIDVSITKKKLKCAKKKLRLAFVEYYRGLGLLKTFSSLNMLAIGKILKKYDKVTGRNASNSYLKALERSRLNNSDKVDYLMEEVERLFVQNFAKNDRRKAIIQLKPLQGKTCHATTYFVGLFSGWSLSFLVAFFLLLHLDHAPPEDSTLEDYGRVVYPIYSVLLLALLHVFMYGWNVYLWCRVRINYPFIFEFGPRTELRSREILLVCTCLTTVVVASMVFHLIFYLHAYEDIFFNPNSIPFATLLVCIFFLFCPFNIFHRSSRYFFLNCMKRIMFSPFYKVVFADFFLADQLTSQVAAIRQIQYITCYYFGGTILAHDTVNTCGGATSHQYAYILSFLPYWWRLMQCLRRWFDEGDKVHLGNGGKYLSAMIAIGFRLTFQFYPSKIWFIIFILTSSIATIYQMYWDVVMDWGLLKPNSKNPWLRDQLILKHKSLYFISIGINCILRFAWLQSLTHFQYANSNDHYLTDFFLATLEVIRRGHWNFYRLENEHLSNVGNYRAVKNVPLPFRDEFVTNI